MATTVSGNGNTAEAIPLDRVRKILSEHGVRAP
jgi:D-aminopeptidase